VLRRTCGPNRDEVTVEWRGLLTDGSFDLSFSPNIIRVIESRRMRWAQHTARMRKRRGVHRVLVEKPEGMRHNIIIICYNKDNI
jgi:hypothetical protein